MGLIFDRKGNDVDGVNQLGAEFDDLRQSDSARIDRMKTYREEGEASRKDNVMAKVNQPDLRDYGRGSRRVHEQFRHDIPLPLGKALTVKHAYRISGKLPDCVVDRRDESPQERYRSDTMEKIVWAIMRASRGATQFASGAWDGSELGATCFDVYYDRKLEIPRFRACDPIGLVVVQGVEDPHDFQRVYRAWEVPLSSLRTEYAGKEITGKAGELRLVRADEITHSHMQGMTEMVTVVRMSDKTRHVTFVPHCGVKLEEYVHDYGFTPYVVIPNIGPERDVWGWADYEFVRSISAYISALFSREADILRAVANGTYIDKGTGQNAELVKAVLSEGGVVPSKATGSLDPVQPPEVPAFAEAHAGRAMEMLKMLGFAPDAAWGSGFSGSGTDRGLMLQPLVEFTAMKQLNWEAGLGRLFGMAYQLIEKKLVGTTKMRGAKPSAYGGRAGNRTLPFVVTLGSNLDPQKLANPDAQASPEDPGADLAEDQFIELPRTPKELFDGDYEVRFIWNNRIDPDDPSYVLSELGKFQHGAQSLETTLERLGFESPQDEIKRIEKEAELYPWLNQGMIALVRAQLSGGGQGQGGGNPDPQSADVLNGATATADQGAQYGADAGAQALGGGQSGQLYGGA